MTNNISERSTCPHRDCRESVIDELNRKVPKAWGTTLIIVMVTIGLSIIGAYARQQRSDQKLNDHIENLPIISAQFETKESAAETKIMVGKICEQLESIKGMLKDLSKETETLRKEDQEFRKDMYEYLRNSIGTSHDKTHTNSGTSQVRRE